MAKIEVGTINVNPQQSSGGASGGVSGTLAFNRGLNDLSRGADKLGNVLAGIAIDTQTRDNQRVVQKEKLAYSSYRTEVLYGENGIAHRVGNDAEGMTEEGTRLLEEYIQKRMPDAPNHVVRTALATDLNKDLARTTELLSRDEGSKLEKARQSDAVSLLAKTRQNVTQFERERLLVDASSMASVKQYADLVSDYEELILASNPGIGDEAVSNTARTLIAEDAVNAAFAAAADGDIGGAMQLQTQYEPEWTVEQASVVQQRIIDEASFGMMNTAIAEAGAQLGEDVSELALREGAVEIFSAAYSEQFGGNPPKEILLELERRASETDRLADDARREVQERTRHSALTNTMKTMRNGSPQAVSTAFDDSFEEAYQTNDVALLKDLRALEKNYLDETTEGFFSAKLTETGAKLLLTPSHNLTQSAILAAAPYMPQGVWERWITVDREDFSGTSNTALAQAQVSYRAGRGLSLLKPGTIEYEKKMDAMRQLDADFVRDNGRKPNPTELRDMTHAAEFGLNDEDQFDAIGAVEGTLGEFLADPQAAGTFQIDEARDRFILDTALLLSSQNTIVRIQAEKAIGGPVTQESLAAHPQVLADLIRYGITSNSVAGFGRTPIKQLGQKLGSE